MDAPNDAALSVEDRELIRRVLELMGIRIPTLAQFTVAVRIIGYVAETLMAREQASDDSPWH